MAAMRVMILLPFAIFITTAVASCSRGVVHCGGDDEAGALLAFKAELASHGSALLPSWNESTGFCSWEGVGCDHSRGRVVALSLPSYGLTGTLSTAIGNLTFLRTLNLRLQLVPRRGPSEPRAPTASA